MGIKVKIIEKSKPGHPEEKYYCAVTNENGMTKYFVMKVSNQTQIYKLKPRFLLSKIPFPRFLGGLSKFRSPLFEKVK